MEDSQTAVSADNATVHEKILRGDYDDPPYTPPPVKPAVMTKRVIDLTPEEIAGINDAAREYHEAYQNYLIEREAREKLITDKFAMFRRDLESEFGMTGHAKAELLWNKALWNKAWDTRHDSSYSGVLLQYEDLIKLVR